MFIPAGIIEWLFGIEDGTLWVPAQFVGSGLGAIAAIVIVFRRATRVDGRNTVFGTARWANKVERKALTDPKAGLLIGRATDRSKALLLYDGVAHLLTLAPTRSDKGVGTIIPNLLTADRSVICIDPKGESARVAGRWRESFGRV